MTLIEDRTTHANGPAGRSYQIGEVSALTGLTQRTLRHYDDLGIMHPAGRTSGMFRLYTEAQVRLLATIASLRPLGLDLALVRQLVSTLDPDAAERDPAAAAAVIDALERRQQLAAAQIADAAASRDRLQQVLGQVAGTAGEPLAAAAPTALPD